MKLKNLAFFTIQIALALWTSTTLANKEKIIIDADVGIDDAMAILLAESAPELDLIAITTTFGNATIEDSSRNALYLVQRLGIDIPVVQGARKPLILPEGPPTDFVHGANGLGNIEFTLKKAAAVHDLSAAEYIIEQSRRYPGELTIVPVGRLTNLALALALDPTLPERIKRVVIMGGAFAVPGNVTPVAEANIIGDPHAADIVFSANWPLVAIGLDVTTQVVITPADLHSIENRNPKTGQLLTAISEFYLAFYRSVGVTEGFYLHDPAAVLYLTHPDLFTLTAGPVRVVDAGLAIGQTIVAPPSQFNREGDWHGIPHSHYASDVDEQKATDIFITRMKSLQLAR